MTLGARPLMALAFACWMATLGSCVTKPTMHLNHAEISGAQLSTFPPSIGIVLTAFVDVYNPNSYDVAVRAMRGQVVVGNGHMLPVDYRAQGDGVWLAAGKTTSVRVPVAIPIDLGLMLLRESAAEPFIPYRLTGRADVTASNTFRIEKDDYAVDEQGTISRQQIAAVIPNTFCLPAPM